MSDFLEIVSVLFPAVWQFAEIPVPGLDLTFGQLWIGFGCFLLGIKVFKKFFWGDST